MPLFEERPKRFAEVGFFEWQDFFRGHEGQAHELLAGYGRVDVEVVFLEGGFGGGGCGGHCGWYGRDTGE